MILNQNTFSLFQSLTLTTNDLKTYDKIGI